MYDEVSNEELSLRDRLAIARTVLANERTLLAYWRTALAFLITGFSLIRFFDSIKLEIVGWIMILISVIFVYIGLRHSQRMSKSIRAMRQKDTGLAGKEKK